MAAKKILSNVFKSAGTSATLPPSLPHWLYSSSSSCLSNTIFGRTYFTSPFENDINVVAQQVNADPPLDTSNLDTNQQPLMGMHGFDFKRILFCSTKGFWHRKLLLETEMRQLHSIITLNVDTVITGVSIWKQGMEDVNTITIFPTQNMKSELMELMRTHCPYGLIIGYPGSPDGGVNQFLFNLDSLLEFSGVPICLINDFGSSQNFEEEVKNLVEFDESNRKGSGLFDSTYQFHKNRLAAKKLMIRFLRTVAPDFLPQKYK